MNMTKEQRTESAKRILNHTVGQHLRALRQLTDSTLEQRTEARKALRKWIGAQGELAFKDLDDMGILCLFLEEFFTFGAFIMQDTYEEISKEDIEALKARAIEFLNHAAAEAGAGVNARKHYTRMERASWRKLP